MRREPTKAERVMWRILRARRLEGLKFRRQVPIGDYIADFASLGRRLIVEIDGGQHAESSRDGKRDAWLQSQGFRVLRFWNAEVEDAPDYIVAGILKAAKRDDG